MTSRLLPHPRLSLFVALIWLALVNEVSIGAVVMGLALGILMPMLTGPFWPDAPRLRRPLKMLDYAGVVIWDIVVANLQVARLILRVPNDQLRSRYVTVPLELTSPEAITVLAGTITMTPGTLTADFSADGRTLLIHSLHAPEPDAIRTEIKTRYEARLKRIFE